MNPAPFAQPAAMPVSAKPRADISIEMLVIDVYESASKAQQSHMLAQLVGRVYKSAPPVIRRRMLERLLRPLGLLSLTMMANGVFAKFRFRNESLDLDAMPDIGVGDVVVLADHVQSVSFEAVSEVAQMLAGSPVVMASAAATVLITLLMKRSSPRHSDGAVAQELTKLI